MKSLNQYIVEKRKNAIDDQWIYDDKPVSTADGRPVIVTSLDLEEVPNIIHGKVKLADDLLVDYEWTDDGECKKAVDKFGNPKKPHESDNLIKVIS